ncbi:MAG: outer membrane protein assembly factor BamD, partial [Gemmatimonadales bacterium]|nr:outer membrane protein assembly factor BamD [Gemmatimonadales bacterium]
MTRFHLLLLAVGTLPLAGCGGGRPPESAETSPAVPAQAEGASPQEVDSLYRLAQSYVRRGKWGDAIEHLERVLLEFSPGDSRIPQARYFLGEATLGIGSHLEAAREFRRVSDETPNDRLAPEALLRVGDVYADLWRRPELDPSYGQTALATYQELLNRYASTPAAARAQARIRDLQERFAYKEYRAALYYFKLKAYDSAILYLKDVVATYPRASIA